jgi:hypothetical protein
MKKAVLVVVPLLLCAGAFGGWHLYQRKLASDQLEAVLAGVKSGLRDPSSAQFRGLVLRSSGRIVCGEVNSKNAYGAYAGFVRFMSASDRYALEDTPTATWHRKDTMGGVDDSIADLREQNAVLGDEMKARAAGAKHASDGELQQRMLQRSFQSHWRRNCEAS